MLKPLVFKGFDDDVREKSAKVDYSQENEFSFIDCFRAVRYDVIVRWDSFWENERNSGVYMEKTYDPSEGVVERLAKRFDLELPGKFTQDWEYIVAKAEQLDQYIAYYQSGALCGLEKELLMLIILQAYDDYTAFGEQKDGEDIYKTPISECLRRDYLLHKETIDYWALEDDEMDEVFSITPFVREIKLQMDEKKVP